LFSAMAAVLILGVSGCSREQRAEKKKVKEWTDQRAKAIKDFAKRPMDRARQAQQIGNEHTGDVDQAIEKTMNGR
jgi:hypothetical protein